MFIGVSFHTHIQSFSFTTCQLCAQIFPYYNVLPGAVFCCFNTNYNVYKIFNLTLHAGLANPTCMQSFMVWYCLVYELRESNSKKNKEKNMTNGRTSKFVRIKNKEYRDGIKSKETRPGGTQCIQMACAGTTEGF